MAGGVHRGDGPVPARAQGRPGRRRPRASSASRRSGECGGSAGGSGEPRRGAPVGRGAVPGGAPMDRDVFQAMDRARRRADGGHGDDRADRGRPAVGSGEPGPVRARRGAAGRDHRLQRPGPQGRTGRGRAAGGGGAVGPAGLHQLRGRARRGRGRGVPGGLRRPAPAGRRGAGPVADALAAIGGIVGLAVRAEPPASAAFEEATQGLGPGDAVVFVDHDDPALVPALTGLLGGRAGYIGVMGSRRHTPGFVARLRDTGPTWAVCTARPAWTWAPAGHRDRAVDPGRGDGRDPRPSGRQPQHRGRGRGKPRVGLGRRARGSPRGLPSPERHLHHRTHLGR